MRSRRSPMPRDSESPTKGNQLRATGIIAAVIGVILLISLLAVGAWKVGWIFKEANTGQQSIVFNESYQRQQALVTSVDSQIQTVAGIDTQLAEPDAPTQQLQAQRIATVSSICQQSGRLTGTVTLSPSDRAFVTKECG